MARPNNDLTPDPDPELADLAKDFPSRLASAFAPLDAIPLAATAKRGAPPTNAPFSGEGAATEYSEKMSLILSANNLIIRYFRELENDSDDKAMIFETMVLTTIITFLLSEINLSNSDRISLIPAPISWISPYSSIVVSGLLP